MIQKLNSKSRVTEVDAACMRIIGAYQNTSLSTDVHLAAMFSALEPLSVSLSGSINRITAESNLEEKDEERDEPLRSLFYLVAGFLHHPDATIRAAAEKVNAVIERYGMGITKESYAVESSLVSSMLKDLAQPKLQDAIALLSGCAEIIAALQLAQTAFETARIAYEEEKADDSTQQSASEIKVEVLELVNKKIVVYLRAMEVVDVETFGAFARTVAEIIADNNQAVRKRLSKPEPVEE
ncbi:hypothetical protein SAMN05444285_1355 [Draconibacterium orientale]|uniref:Uncharacterized protein n=1 Tax=Draconibacterium orientale TaxID=1168034 RepID=X5DLQ1_9BACT|nr:DUF6261 family protein [Draconibacterium orientale]AHW62174.1 hypothetical protein FH5T_16545 [Draconibacterium orientale]SEU01077.1 hypothetical protein SAMN05444285_1355 [Draconibacterium orientale]